MKAAGYWITIGVTVLALTACSSGQRRGPPTKVINQALSTAPGKAQPSQIVAREIEYAQAAKEQGQFVAAEDFAAPGALMHVRGGPVPFSALASLLKTADIQTQWKPRTVVMSCDGALAISQGRFADKDGKVGNYVTTWVRQSDNSYKWSYDVAGYDDPQPPPRQEFEDGDIVVTAIDAVQGLVASCPRGGVAPPPPPAIPIGEEGKSDAQLSSDGTMRWRWEHAEDGMKNVVAEYFYEGRWVTAVEESLAPIIE
ncbi:hypothetical protein [Erythrobacter sp. YT30]|uniref:hypothetical protein n=1 Tax=Erythrobacter sp. YT30 TaxID=1735012 RepID=UPI0009EA8905|nr:hypothetical protein [Erythrobacter sp. YT30]